MLGRFLKWMLRLTVYTITVSIAAAFLVPFLVSNFVPQPTFDPVDTTRTATEEVMLFDNEWCATGCLSLREWRLGSVQDERLLLGLSIAYQHNPEWRPLAQVMAKMNTKVFWASGMGSARGSYISLTNSIAISVDLVYASPSVVASILAHEVTHAYQASQDWHLIPKAEECVANEAEAFAWEADTWNKVKTGNEDNDYGMNEIFNRWVENDLVRFVRENPAYQHQCRL